MYKWMYDSLYVPLHVNVASLERVLRVLVGIVFLALAITGPRSIWGLLGLVPLITGATGYCPFYAALASLSHPRRLPHTSRHGLSH